MSSGERTCSCRFPVHGPLYWDFKCLRCDASIGYVTFRWFRRKSTLEKLAATERSTP